MTEHHHPEEVKQSVVVETGPSGGWLLPATMLVGSVIIAGSILYNGKQTISQLENISFSGSGGQTVQAGGGSVQPKEVKLSIRKDAPVIGNGKGKVTIIEYSDFQCPFCQRFFQDAYTSVKNKYVDSGKVKFVFQHFPLPFHANAQKAGEAAECAAKQNKFTQYHDLLFNRGKADGAGLSIDDLKKYASELGLNSSRFNSCLDNNDTANIVKADMTQGTSFGVSGTPSFLIVKDNDFTVDAAVIASAAAQGQNIINLPNGNVFVVGAQPFSVFEQVLDQALQ